MKNKCHIEWKIFWEKEKLLVTRNFSFSHNVFHSYISLVHQNVALGGNGLNVNNKLKFGLGRVENIVGKGENAGYQHFLLLLRCFQKGIFLISLKVGIVLYRVNSIEGQILTLVEIQSINFVDV